jgi:uncharacterized delta-60 repeat protein
MIKKVHPIPVNKLIASLTFFCLIGLLPAPVAADLTPGRLDTGFNVGTGTNDSFYSMAIEKDGGVLIGGRFTQINGFNQSNLARIARDGSPATFTPQVNDAVYAVAVQPDSKILIGGDFSSVNGVPRHRIARLNPDGSLDSGFNPGLDLSAVGNTIFGMALQPDGKVVVCGSFAAGGHQNMARLNADGALDPGFQTGTGLNDFAANVAVQSDGRILVGGRFTLVNGVSRNRIARLNGDGSLDTGFNPGTGADGNVATIAIQTDQKIIIGGGFQLFNGVSRKYVARLNPDGTLDTSFSADQKNAVEDLAFMPDGRILISGFFSPPDGCPTCQWIARYSTSGVIDPSFIPVTLTSGSGVYTMAVQDDGGILIGGNFIAMNLLTHQENIARLNPDGTVDSGFSLANVNGWVMAAAVDDWGKNYLGGWFSVYTNTNPPGFVVRNSVVRLNMDGSLDGTFDPGQGADNWVNTLVLDTDRSVYLGGIFTAINTVPRGGIAKLNPDGSLNGTFNLLGVNPGAGDSISALVLQPDQKILAGGKFNVMNVFPRKNLARLNAAGAVDTGFIADTDSDVFVLALQNDGKILAGGKFTLVNGTPRTYLARLNPDGSPDVSFNPNLNNEVWAIRIQADGKILIGGIFTTIDGVARSGIARLLPNGVLDTGFNPGTGTNGPVSAIATQRDGRILIGGLFTTLNSINRNGIARLNPDGSLNPDFDPGTGAGGTNPPFTLPWIRTILPQYNSRILIGGLFDQYDGSTRSYVGRLNGHSATAFFGQPPITAELGKPFYHALQATGLPSPRFQVTSGTLPPGLTLGRYTGVISGIPQQVGTFNLTVSAYNQFPPTAAQTFTLTVDNAHHYLPLILRH